MKKWTLITVLVGLGICTAVRSCEEAAARRPAAALSLVDRVDMCGLLLEYIMVMEPVEKDAILARGNMLHSWLLAMEGESDTTLLQVINFVKRSMFVPIITRSVVTAQWKERYECAYMVKTSLLAYLTRGRGAPLRDTIASRLDKYLERLEEISQLRTFFIRTQPYFDRQALEQCLSVYGSMRFRGCGEFDFGRYAALCVWLVASNSPGSCGDKEARSKAVSVLQKHFSQVMFDVPLLSTPCFFYTSESWCAARDQFFSSGLIELLLREADSLVKEKKEIADFVPCARELYEDVAVAATLLDGEALSVLLGEITGKPFERPYRKPYKRLPKGEQEAIIRQAKSTEAARLCAQKIIATRFAQYALPAFRDYCAARIGGYEKIPAWGVAGAPSEA